MQQSTTPAPSPSFAGLLASLAAPAQKSGAAGDGSSPAGWSPSTAWNDDDLADDVATLSYESALRAHARYRSAAPTDQSLTQAADLGPIYLEDSFAAASAAPPQPANLPTANQKPIANRESEPNRLRNAPFERNLKDASITVRMSKAECAQLQRRAAEAGLTVSAYLRSCTFEAESLRALVKDTLAQLRSTPTPAKPSPNPDRPANPAPPRRSRFRGAAARLARLCTPWHDSQRAARA
jgi:predicted DNA binding CopG/RHH family protein